MSEVLPNLDLRPDHWDIVRGILHRHVPDRKVLAFGSRATWSAKDYSDLDIAVLGDEPLPLDVASALAESFGESDLPFKVDVVDWTSASENFRKVIENNYVLLVEKKEQGRVDEWQSTTLGELIEIKHGFAFKGHSINEKRNGDLLLTPGNFAVGGGFKSDKFKYYDGLVPEEFVLREGDLLVTMTDLSKQSDTLGYPAFVPARTDDRRYLHNQRLGKISLKETSDLDARYLYYIMCSTEYRHEVLASATGTTVKHTSPDRIKQFRFHLPPLPEQCAIAHNLGTLDDKIELNRRMNETLEAMARALFKSWFVDFDPVRAKMEGRDTGLPMHIANLFPDQLVDSELGEIPEGWEVKTIGELIELAYGKALKASSRKNGSIPVYGSNGRVGWHDKKLVAGPGIVVGRKGNPGTVTWAYDNFFPIDTTFYVAPKNASQSLPFLFFALTSQDLPSIAADSAVPGLNRNLVYMNKQLVPSKMIIDKFSHWANAFFERRHHLEEESRTLAALRDALLPKLVSGELRVRSRERG